MEIATYKAVTAKNAEILTQLVNGFIGSGWQPFGNVVYHYYGGE